VDQYSGKGGNAADTVGRRCLCNGLMAAAGHPQLRAGGFTEPPIVTSGDDLVGLSKFLSGRSHYAAADVVAYLLSGAP
jgi:nitronate monooxygenase